MLYDYGPRWADVEGEGDLAVITFGSTSGAVREAVQRLAEQGTRVKLIVLRLLAPVQTHLFDQALRGVKQVLVVEQNHGAQLYRYLRAMLDLPGDPKSFHKPGPLPLRPGELAKWIAERCDALQKETA
jgi:2-oxoglutarate ferredoxin oxidoreductase subunit alpha